MVDFLVGLHAGEEFGFDVIVGPAEVKSEVLDGVSLQVPLFFLDDMFDNSVLGFWMRRGLPLTLMTIFCFLELNWLL